jgi:hypothetical protein
VAAILHLYNVQFINLSLGSVVSIGNGPGPVSVDGSGTVCRLLSPQGITVDPSTGMLGGRGYRWYALFVCTMMGNTK